jgi:hypothetical protein
MRAAKPPVTSKNHSHGLIELPCYQPSTDPEPGASVTALVRYGDPPSLRRWERTGNGLWTQRGSIIGVYLHIHC